jgi:hypothetical protein
MIYHGSAMTDLATLADRLEEACEEVRHMQVVFELRSILAALRQHAERGGWVPVSERLPENQNITSTMKGSRFARVLGCNAEMPQLGSFVVYLRFPGDYWDARKEYAWETPAGEAIEITHWQLLPDPTHRIGREAGKR